MAATATAVALLLDAARMPVYLATQGREILDVWPFVVVGTMGVLVGTLLGERVLRRVPECFSGEWFPSLFWTWGS